MLPSFLSLLMPPDFAWLFTELKKTENIEKKYAVFSIISLKSKRKWSFCLYFNTIQVNTAEHTSLNNKQVSRHFLCPSPATVHNPEVNLKIKQRYTNSDGESISKVWEGRTEQGLLVEMLFQHCLAGGREEGARVPGGDERNSSEGIGECWAPLLKPLSGHPDD